MIWIQDLDTLYSVNTFQEINVWVSGLGEKFQSEHIALYIQRKALWNWEYLENCMCTPTARKKRWRSCRGHYKYHVVLSCSIIYEIYSFLMYSTLLSWIIGIKIQQGFFINLCILSLSAFPSIYFPKNHKMVFVSLFITYICGIKQLGWCCGSTRNGKGKIFINFSWWYAECCRLWDRELVLNNGLA